jgi:hypothetical protein
MGWRPVLDAACVAARRDVVLDETGIHLGASMKPVSRIADLTLGP